MKKNFRPKGFIFIISSPSGCGKTMLAKTLLKDDANLKQSISVTTRPKRKGEVSGQDYFFIDGKEYKRMLEDDLLLEHAKIFGNLYGSPKKNIEEILNQGKDVLCVIDWQGAVELMKKVRKDLVTVFILPPALSELKKRLTGRATDSSEVMKRRLNKAKEEISKSYQYDYIVINDDFATCASQLKMILGTERLKRVRQDMIRLISAIEKE